MDRKHRQDLDMDVAVARANRQAQALRLRAAGSSYDHIAQELGYANRSGAYKAVKKALRDTVARPAEELRQLELARLDGLLGAVWPIATNPEHPECLKAVDRVLRIIDEQSRLTGLVAWPVNGG